MKGGKKRRLTGTDRAASSVIGVNIMVAITVILASVLGVFAMDVGNNLRNVSESASFDVSVNAAANEVNVSHKGGDVLVASNAKIVVSNETTTLEFTSSNSTPLVAGDSFSVETNSTTVSGWSGAVFTLESNDGGDETATQGNNGNGVGNQGNNGNGVGNQGNGVGNQGNDGDGGSGFTITTGDSITVMLIDTDGQHLVLKTTVTA